MHNESYGIGGPHSCGVEGMRARELEDILRQRGLEAKSVTFYKARSNFL